MLSMDRLLEMVELVFPCCLELYALICYVPSLNGIYVNEVGHFVGFDWKMKNMMKILQGIKTVKLDLVGSNPKL